MTSTAYYSIWKLLAVLGCGLTAGVFFAFSSFVMGALARLAPSDGIAAMQSINRVVVNLSFMGVFMGTAAICTLLIFSSLSKWHPPDAAYWLAGSLLYLVGTFLVTIAFNVPLNDALAAVDPDSAKGVSLWAMYLERWTMWNHVRTIAAIAATVAFSTARVSYKLYP